MNLSAPIGYGMVNQNSKAFQGKKLPKKPGSIELAFEQELAEIRRQKQDAEIIRKLDLKGAMESVKNKIQITIDNMTKK